jgi:CheY-like chemotaxis protein
MQDMATILVVDDDAEIRHLVAGYLADQGYRTLTAADAGLAREAIDAEQPDLVVLDVMMPGEDGLSLLQELRTRSELPVILLTALGDEADRVAGLELGADDYLSKPFGPRELLARIRTVLRRSGAPSSGQHGRARFRFEGWTLDARRASTNCSARRRPGSARACCSSSTTRARTSRSRRAPRRGARAAGSTPSGSSRPSTSPVFRPRPASPSTYRVDTASASSPRRSPCPYPSRGTGST